MLRLPGYQQFSHSAAWMLNNFIYACCGEVDLFFLGVCADSDTFRLIDFHLTRLSDHLWVRESVFILLSVMTH